MLSVDENVREIPFKKLETCTSFLCVVARTSPRLYGHEQLPLAFVVEKSFTLNGEKKNYKINVKV